MRVLCTVWTVPSHLQPLLPVVRALLAAGDEVLVVTTARLAPAVAATGARVEAVLTDPDPDGEPTDEPTDFDSPLAVALAQVLNGARLREQVPRVLALAERFDPHLVVRDDAEFTGYLAAMKLKVPLVCLAGAMSNHFETAAIAAVLDGYRERIGLDTLSTPDQVYPGPVLDYLPEQLSLAANTWSRTLRFRQPLGESDAEPLPPELLAVPGDAPLVVVGIGTAWQTWQKQPGGGEHDPREVLRAWLDALSDVHCAALVSTGGLSGAGLTHADHVLVREHVPQRLALQNARLFATHAGYNSIREALRCGVPMLLSPLSMDQPANASAVHALGLGQVVSTDDPAGLADTIRAVLADDAQHARARTAQRGVLALPGIETAPAELARLC